jgi:dTMP kinase
MSGLFITFEGTEGGGKSTQIARLVERLTKLNLKVRSLREPGGTPVGEEIRHTLKHSPASHAMTAETELLLVNASRAQLVREVIRPALAAGEIVLCDRFYDSTVAYQGHGRALDLAHVRNVIRFAVGETIPNITLLLRVPLKVSEARRAARGSLQPDRFEDANREFFLRVERGYDAIAQDEPERVKVIDATRTVENVAEDVWREIQPLLPSH